MIRVVKKISYFIVCLLMLLSSNGFIALKVNAQDKKVYIPGKVYTLDADKKYDYSQLGNRYSDSDNFSIGDFFIKGDIVPDGTKNGFQSFNSVNGIVDFGYYFENLEQKENEWHLVKDDVTEVCGIDLAEKMNLGAYVLQISFDGEKWTDVGTYTDVFSSKPDKLETIYKTYDNQIMNGCFYRVLVAYKMKKTTSAGGILGIGKKELANRFVEVYEFYLHSNDLSSVIQTASAKTSYRVGPELFISEKDTGYYELFDITRDDSHFGWSIGDFYIRGFSGLQEEDDTLYFLKNPGDKITLSFVLSQDIKQLNGNKKLKIYNDYNGYNASTQFQPEDGLKRGLLIVSFLNSHNEYETTQFYTDYLAACASQGADTTVQIFEEGDYLIELDYEIWDTRKPIEKFENYVGITQFSIRNSDTTIFFLDTKTGSTLENNSFTSNGFKVDFANSKYLNVQIQKKKLNNETLSIDPGFNRTIADGSVFTDEGIYIITAENPTTHASTEWTIYVGDNPILKAYAKNSGSYNIKEINQKIKEGYTIDGEGNLIPPEVKEVVEEPEDTIVATNEPTNTPTETPQLISETSQPTIESDIGKEENSSSWLFIVGAVVLIGVVSILLVRKPKNTNAQKGGDA